MKNLIIIFSIVLNFSAFAGCYEKVDLSDIGSKTDAWECDDGTVSFDQNTRYSDRKEKKDDYESLCGSVAAANVFHAYCENLFVNHVKIAGKYFGDITPGIRPDTLEAGLNNMFDNNSECMSGNWKYYYSKTRWDFLNSLYYEVRRGHGFWTRKISESKKSKRSPVIVLIATTKEAKFLHYVTVVDVIGYDPKKQDYENKNCKVIYNDYGGQTKTSCETFVKYAHQIDNNTFTGWMNEYTHIVFEENELAKLVKDYRNALVKKTATKASTKALHRSKYINPRK